MFRNIIFFNKLFYKYYNVDNKKVRDLKLLKKINSFNGKINVSRNTKIHPLLIDKLVYVKGKNKNLFLINFDNSRFDIFENKNIKFGDLVFCRKLPVWKKSKKKKK